MLEPDSTAVVWALWALAASGVVGICWFWPRLANRGAASVIGRVLTQVVASTLVVLAVAGMLNQQNGWYGTWTDLGNDFLGQQPAIAAVNTQGQLQAQKQYDVRGAQHADRLEQRKYGVQRADFQQALRLSKKPTPTGQYVSVRVPGLGRAAGPQAGRVLVWLPPSYVTGSQQTTYPVIEAFAGIPGSPRDYQKRMGLQNIIAEVHRTSGLVQPIVIIPDYTPGGLDTECVDAPGVAMETWVTKTIPDWVRRHLRVRPDKASWATMGFSAGAFCAEVSAVLHPTQYGAVMIFGGYNHPEWGRWLPFGKSTAWPERYNLLEVLRLQPPPIDVWIEQSEADVYSKSESASFIHAVHAPTSVTTVQLQGAGHRFGVWQGVMPNALQWLASAEPGFHASSAHGAPDVRHAS